MIHPVSVRLSQAWRGAGRWRLTTMQDAEADFLSSGLFPIVSNTTARLAVSRLKHTNFCLGCFLLC